MQGGQSATKAYMIKRKYKYTKYTNKNLAIIKKMSLEYTKMYKRQTKNILFLASVLVS